MKQKRFYYLLGLTLVVLCYLPVLLKGTGFLTIIFDQFDGEILTYILQARHLHDSAFPEFMNGLGKSSMTMAAPSFLLPYLFLPAKQALFLTTLLIAFVGYTGMYLAAERLLDTPWIGALIALLFSILPFYSVYGLSVMGQPFLLYAFLILSGYSNPDEGDIRKPSKTMAAAAYMIILIYTVSSSFVLVGYAILAMLLFFGLIMLVKHRPVRLYVFGCLEMLFLYAAATINLILNFSAIGEDFVSHRIERRLSEQISFLCTFSERMLGNEKQAPSFQSLFLPAIPILLILWLLFLIAFRKRGDKSTFLKYRRLLLESLILLAFVIGAALFNALCRCPSAAVLRNHLGGAFVTFQVDRFCWLSPTAWYLLFGYLLYFLSEITGFILHSRRSLKLLPTVLLYSFVFYGTWKEGYLRVNLASLLNQKTYSRAEYASFDEFFQPELFHDISKQIGAAPEDYRCISVGLYPSIALFNGFYTLDGYTNNYPLEYKHKFREIIVGELERNQEIREYFDNWGNRCYALSAELGRHYYIPKRLDTEIGALEYDYEKLKEMNCQYIFSAVRINDTKHLKLVGEYTNDSCRYMVHVYQLL